jgi:hypothetical protein
MNSVNYVWMKRRYKYNQIILACRLTESLSDVAYIKDNIYILHIINYYKMIKIEESQIVKEINDMINNDVKQTYKIKICVVQVNIIHTPYEISIRDIVHLTQKQLDTLITFLKNTYPKYTIETDSSMLYIKTNRKYGYNELPITMKDVINARKKYDDIIRKEEEKCVNNIMSLIINCVTKTLENHPTRAGIILKLLSTPSNHVFLKNENNKTQRYTDGVFTLLSERLSEKFPDFTSKHEIEGINCQIINIKISWDNDDKGQYTIEEHYQK